MVMMMRSSSVCWWRLVTYLDSWVAAVACSLMFGNIKLILSESQTLQTLCLFPVSFLKQNYPHMFCLCVCLSRGRTAVYRRPVWGWSRRTTTWPTNWSPVRSHCGTTWTRWLIRLVCRSKLQWRFVLFHSCDSTWWPVSNQWILLLLCLV